MCCGVKAVAPIKCLILREALPLQQPHPDVMLTVQNVPASRFAHSTKINAHSEATKLENYFPFGYWFDITATWQWQTFCYDLNTPTVLQLCNLLIFSFSIWTLEAKLSQWHDLWSAGTKPAHSETWAAAARGALKMEMGTNLHFHRSAHTRWGKGVESHPSHFKIQINHKENFLSVSLMNE